MLFRALEIRRLQFGAFTLDRGGRRLMRASEPIALPAKAFDLLVYLVENPGRPLSKDELLQSVWPGTIVEESNLTQNVFLLRKAFGSEGQDFIATLSGRGYQFTATVTEQSLSSLIATSSSTDDPALQTIEARSSRMVYEEETEERIEIWRSPMAVGFLAAGLVLLFTVGWLGWQRYEDRVGGPPVQVVVAGFEGGTGDPALNQALNTALRMGLSQSPYVTLVSTAKVKQTLTFMTLKPDAELTPAIAHDVCERTNSQAVLRGTIAQAGSHYLLTGEAVGCPDGTTIATFTEEARDKESLPHAVDKLAASLRRGLGESRRTIARFSQPVIPDTGRTKSIEAMEAYSQSVALAQTGDYANAVELLKQAVTFDPEFAEAWITLSNYAGNDGDFPAMKEYLNRAYAVRSQAPYLVRTAIDARYSDLVKGDLYGAEQIYKTALAQYSRNAGMWSALGQTQRDMGHHLDAANTFARTLQLAPNATTIYYGLCAEQMHAGLLDKARQTCDSGIEHGLDSDQIRLTLLILAALEHDEQLYQQQVLWGEEHQSAFVHFAEAEANMIEGRIQDALTHLDQSCALFGPKQDSVCGLSRFEIADELALEGEIDRARLIIGNRTPDPEDVNGLNAMVLTGKLKEAETILKAQEKDNEASPAWEAKIGAIVRANMLLSQHRPAEVAAALEPVRPFENADLTSWYLRSLGYAQSNQLGKAEAEFRRLLAVKYEDPENVVISLAQLGLARVLANEGKKDDAIREYQTFLQLWRNADKSSSTLKAAEYELSALSSRTLVQPVEITSMPAGRGSPR